MAFPRNQGDQEESLHPGPEQEARPPEITHAENFTGEADASSHAPWPSSWKTEKLCMECRVVLTATAFKLKKNRRGSPNLMIFKRVNQVRLQRQRENR